MSASEMPDTESADEWDEGPVIPRRPIPDAGEMDITPMIDITFLLLIFFIVSSTMSRSGAVPLAKARHGESVDVNLCVEITIDRDGPSGAAIYLAGRPLGEPLSGSDEQQAEAIRAEITAGLKDDGKTAVLVKVEKGVHWRHVQRVREIVAEIEGVEGMYHAVEAVD